MGRQAHFFSVRIDEVRRKMGIKDPHLVRRLKDSAFYEAYGEGSRVFDDAVYDVIMSYRPEHERGKGGGFLGIFKGEEGSGLTESNSQFYGYVMMVLADYCGEHLAELSELYEADQAAELNAALEKVGSTITFAHFKKPKALFDIPTIDLLPIITCLTRDEIRLLLENSLKVKLIEQGLSDRSYRLLEEWIDALEKCRESNTDLLAFSH